MALNTHTIWNGSISFGLVNIPVALHTATSEEGLDFDWLDKRTMDPVGYKRINKQTGEDIEKENIVKGIAYEKGKYVILTDDEIKFALPKTTQTIEIESFVSVEEIPIVYFERPYYLAPSGKSVKAYALLRDTLLKEKRVGVARIVIHTKQHLAAIVPTESALLLIFLRWSNQIRPLSELELPSSEAAAVSERESSMAVQLVEAMTEAWNPEKFKDSFNEKVMALVSEKVNAGKIENVIQSETEPANADLSNVVDLTELLKRSLHKDKVV